VGLNLGDLWAQIAKGCVNPGLCFRQSIIHEDYIKHFYELFHNYCRQGPKLAIPKPDKRTGKVYSNI
jgi:LAGLIDADG DNA endonuclease family